MRLSYARRARLDLSSIHAYVARDSVRSADGVLLDLTDACAALIDFPEQGRVGAFAGTRELVTVRPYVIIYSVSDRGVEIVRIFHGTQDRQAPPSRTP